MEVIGVDPRCGCGEDWGGACALFDSGYPYCRSCAEHHRGPECAVNEDGVSLQWCGCPWDNDEHLPRPVRCTSEPVEDADST